MVAALLVFYLYVSSSVSKGCLSNSVKNLFQYRRTCRYNCFSKFTRPSYQCLFFPFVFVGTINRVHTSGSQYCNIRHRIFSNRFLYRYFNNNCRSTFNYQVINLSQRSFSAQRKGSISSASRSLCRRVFRRKLNSIGRAIRTSVRRPTPFVLFRPRRRIIATCANVIRRCLGMNVKVLLRPTIRYNIYNCYIYRIGFRRFTIQTLFPCLLRNNFNFHVITLMICRCVVSRFNRFRACDLSSTPTSSYC